MYIALQKITVALAVAGYLRSISGLAETTRRNYSSCLRALAAHVSPCLRMDQLTQEHLDSFFDSKADDWTPATYNVNLSILRGFFAWARERNHAPQNWNPLGGRKRLRAGEPDRIWISEEEFERGLDIALDERDRAVWAWGRFMYSRRSELTPKMRDLDMNSGTVRVRIQKKKITTIMKLGPMIPHLERWLDWYQWNLSLRGEILQPDSYILPSRVSWHLPSLPRDPSVYRTRENWEMRLRPLNPIGEPNKIVRGVLVGLGYRDDARLGMHVLRRSGSLIDLEEMEEEGEANPMPIIRERLNHETDAMSAWYTGRSHDRARSDAYYERKGERARTRAQAAGENVISLADRRRAAG